MISRWIWIWEKDDIQTNSEQLLLQEVTVVLKRKQLTELTKQITKPTKYFRGQFCHDFWFGGTQEPKDWEPLD